MTAVILIPLFMNVYISARVLMLSPYLLMFESIRFFPGSSKSNIFKKLTNSLVLFKMMPPNSWSHMFMKDMELLPIAHWLTDLTFVRISGRKMTYRSTTNCSLQYASLFFPNTLESFCRCFSTQNHFVWKWRLIKICICSDKYSSRVFLHFPTQKYTVLKFRA